MLNELGELVFNTNSNSNQHHQHQPTSRSTLRNTSTFITRRAIMEFTFDRDSIRGGQPSLLAAITATNAAAYSLPRARKKIKMKDEVMKRKKKQPPTTKMFNIETNNYSRKPRPPPEPQGAFFFPYVRARFSLLALTIFIFVTLVLCTLIADASRTSETSSGHRHHLTSRQQQEHQQKLQQNKLRYLIARTSLMPQWLDHRHDQQPSHSYELQHQRRTSHMDNNIINHKSDRGHPNSVHRIGSEASVSESIKRRRSNSNGFRRDPIFDRIHAEFRRNHEGYSADDMDPVMHDFDSLDVEMTYPNVDDTDDIDNDVDGVKDDDADNEEDGDDENGDDEEEEVDEADNEDYGTPYDGDSTNNNDDQNTIPLDEESTNKKNRNAKSLHLHSAVSNDQLHRISSHPHRYLNTSINGELEIQSSSQRVGEPSMRPYWGRNLHDVDLGSHGMAITAGPDQYERQPHQLRPRHKSQPSAPYQSPVVVSISDNSFVSASPVSMDANSVNDVEGPQNSEGTTVHYSHIIASPKNELPSYGRRYWHDSHMASIQMVQEEHNELQQGGINSAIIAILFGIGVTGMLIMIVSIKMRSIRERVAYKGRRRSLVPDTDFLINTIPM